MATPNQVSKAVREMQKRADLFDVVTNTSHHNATHSQRLCRHQRPSGNEGDINRDNDKHFSIFATEWVSPLFIQQAQPVQISQGLHF